MPLHPRISPRHVRPQLEELEPRLPPANFQPTPVEQLFLERLNGARANPAASGTTIDLDLSHVAPAPSLAFNTQLIKAARLPSIDMFNRHYFEHVTPEGIDPKQRIKAAGFPAIDSAESISKGFPGVTSALQTLIIDRGIPDLGHRRHLLALDPVFRNQNQVGIGILATGPDNPFLYIPGVGVPGNDPAELFASYFYTIDTAVTRQRQTFLTGAVFRDANGNGRYDIGEGLAGVTIRVSGLRPVQAFNSGGYTVALKHSGNYRVTAKGGDLPGPITRTVHVGASNARLQFIVS